MRRAGLLGELLCHERRLLRLGLVRPPVAIHVSVAILRPADMAYEKILFTEGLSTKTATSSLRRLRLWVDVVAHTTLGVPDGVLILKHRYQNTRISSLIVQYLHICMSLHSFDLQVCTLIDSSFSGRRPAPARQPSTPWHNCRGHNPLRR